MVRAQFELWKLHTFEIPDSIRVVALLGIGRLKGADKRYAGRHAMRSVCFAETWGEGINL